MILSDSRAKIKRANKHIADLEDCLLALHDSQTSAVEINKATGGEILKHDFNVRLLEDMALILGDAVHNLKSALDYTWVATMERLKITVDSRTKFPIRETFDEVQAALHGRKIDTISPELWLLVLRVIQPYDGGNFALWPMHAMDIRDKHHLPIPVLTTGSIDGIEVEQEGATFTGFGVAPLTFQRPPYYIHLNPSIHVKNHGKVTADIGVQYGDAFYVPNISENIQSYSSTVLKIVELFEEFLEALP